MTYKKLYNIDCDGVLKRYTPATEKRLFDSEAVTGIKLLQEMGYEIAIVSGKSIQYLLDIAHSSGVHDFYLIGENGSVVTNSNGERLYVAPKDGYHRLSKALEEYLIKGKDEWKQLKWDEGVGYIMEESKEAMLTFLLKGKMPGFLRYAENLIQDIINSEKLPFQISTNATPYGGYIDITHKDVNKAKGLIILSGYLHAPIDEMSAIGDSENDIPMLKLVGRPRAVGNADEKVKEVVRRSKNGYVATAPLGAGVLEIAQYEKALFS